MTTERPLGLPQSNGWERVGELLLLVATVAVGGVFLWNGLVLALAFSSGSINDVSGEISWWWCLPGMVTLQLAVLAIRRGVRQRSSASDDAPVTTS